MRFKSFSPSRFTSVDHLLPFSSLAPTRYLQDHWKQFFFSNDHSQLPPLFFVGQFFFFFFFRILGWPNSVSKDEFRSEFWPSSLIEWIVGSKWLNDQTRMNRSSARGSKWAKKDPFFSFFFFFSKSVIMQIFANGQVKPFQIKFLRLVIRLTRIVMIGKL